jgi:adenylosuccinate lyase
MSIYGHLWGTDETRELFEDRGRMLMWLDIVATLAIVQAELGLIPEAAARAISDRVRRPVDLDVVADATRASGHSTLGLIRTLQADLDADSREWIYYGATVQDVSDTWTGLVAGRMLEIAERDLGLIDASLARLAGEHRDTVMLGRTHGQPGLPITFGYKAAVWLAEVRRHRERVAQARPRLVVGQLAGAVGTLSAWGTDGLELQRRVLERLGLGVPEIPWTSSRDRVAELVGLLALIAGTLAKAGNEIYNLQRPEIGEVAEAATEGVVGSITMPQKHNPERSEHLVTLARVVRSSADLALEGVVGEHERDGAAWKTEWELLPRACGAAAAALRLGAELLDGLRVNRDRMRANVDAQNGYVLAEPVMLALGERIGPRRAHELVHAAAARGLAAGISFRDALAADADIPDVDLDELLQVDSALGAARELVDHVLGAGDPPERVARATERSQG